MDLRFRFAEPLDHSGCFRIGEDKLNDAADDGFQVREEVGKFDEVEFCFYVRVFRQMTASQ